jgi:hypothetical protein
MYLDPTPVFPAAVVSRPTTFGVGRHVGVLLPHGYVAHKMMGGSDLVPLDVFSGGGEVRIDREIAPEHLPALLERFETSFRHGNDYRLLSNNCEHYAYGVADGNPRSPQVALAIAAAVGACYLFGS